MFSLFPQLKLFCVIVDSNALTGTIPQEVLALNIDEFYYCTYLYPMNAHRHTLNEFLTISFFCVLCRTDGNDLTV